MSSVHKLSIAAAALTVASGLASIATVDQAVAAGKCVGCSVHVANTSHRTVYKTKVVYAVRDVTLVRNVTRVNVVHAAPRGRALVWPGENHPSAKYCQ